MNLCRLGNMGDKTMDDKLICIPNNLKQKIPLLEPTNLDNKSTQSFVPTNKIVFKLWVPV